MKTITRCVCQLIETQVVETPDRIAIAFNDRVLTYRELNERSNQFARYLQSFGVSHEVLVGVCVERSPEMFVILLGILKTGGIYVPLDPSYPSERIAFALQDSQVSVLVTQKHIVENLSKLPQIQTICIDTNWREICQQETSNLNIVLQPHHLAYIIYTSGSTGKPKGVQIEHRGLANLLISLSREPGITQDDIWLGVTTIAFDMSVPELYLPLIVGAKICLVDRQVATNPKRLREILDREKITVLQATPSTWRMLLNAGWRGNAHLKMLCGGEATPRSLANLLLEGGGELWHMYGPTETTVWSTIHRVKPEEEGVPLGHPIANTQIYLLEQVKNNNVSTPLGNHLQTVPSGKIGELYIGGDGLARGYLNRSELNQERFIGNPFSRDPKAKLYKTGDLARYNSDGNLEFIGRADQQVKIRGHRIELGEIENAIAQYSGIKEAAVITKEDVSGTQNLVAYVVANTEESTHTLHSQQVEKWQEVWSFAYRNTTGDPLFDYSGWHNSYTGLPMPEEEVREWVDRSVARILHLKPQNLLEIGCGKGMLLFQIAPHCDRYVGTDLSPDAIAHIGQQLEKLAGDWSHVTVKPGAADQLEGLEPASFDTIVLNSVIQYFPNLDYLVRVIENILPLVKPGGHIFIGDIRSLPLLEAFHTSVQLNRAPASLSTLQLKQRIQEQIEQDGELVLHPDFFLALKSYFPHIAFVQTLLKEGLAQNELVVFRSDVILNIAPREIAIAASPIYFDWQQQNWSVSAMLHWLKQNQTELIKIENIPNLRITSDLQAAKLLHQSNLPETVGGLRAKLVAERQNIQVHPETWWKLGVLLDYQIDINWSDAQREGCYDVVLRRDHISPLPERKIEIKPLREYANNPSRATAKQNLIPQLREFLQTKLPSYMIPSIFMPLNSFPLTPNGKIDRRALPEPKSTRPLLDKTFATPETAIEKKLAEIWAQLLTIKEIGIHDSFTELGGHSLLTVQLLSQIEEEFQVEIALMEFLHDPTISGLAKALSSRQKSNDRPLTVDKAFAIDIHQDTVLDSTIYPATIFLDPVSEPEHIFLTGVTGFLGAFFLQELLKQTDSKIYCLVRATKLEEGKYRLQQNLKRYLLWNQTWDSRLIPVVGDLAKPMFGMASQEFRELAQTTDLIYHCGAFINLIYPYSVLRKPNVLGTREVLRLASQGRVTPIHFISTFDVFLSPHYSQREVLYEEESVVYPEQLANGYAQSKWVAEQLLLTARERGIPASIYRLPMISGHSQTGVANPDDLLCRFIAGTIQLGSAPLLDRPISMIPVDYVSKAIVHLSGQSDSLNKVFHFSNPNPLSCDRFVETLREMGYRISEMSYSQWLKKLQHPQVSRDNVLSPLASLLAKTGEDNLTYLETTLFSTQVIDCQNTLTRLRGTGIVCPPVNSQLIQTYVSKLYQNDTIARIYKRFSQSNALVNRNAISQNR